MRSSAFTAPSRAGVLCLVVLASALASGCGGSSQTATPPSRIVTGGSWYPYEAWPHDGKPYESEHFVVYSDTASEAAKREAAGARTTADSSCGHRTTPSDRRRSGTTGP